MSPGTEKSIVSLPVYPALIAIAPVFNLFALNRQSLGWLDLIRPLAVCFALYLIAMALAKMLRRDRHGSALIATILIASFITYGYAAGISFEVLGEQFTALRLPVVWLALTVLMAAVAAILLRRVKNGLRETTIILNVFALVLMASGLLPMLGSGSDVQRDARRVQSSAGTTSPTVHEWLPQGYQLPARKNLPDFYYIIVDAYARDDILLSRFGYDNAEMTTWLEEQGFHVGREAIANYAWTHLSLGATLNGDYLQSLVAAEFSDQLPEPPRERVLYVKEAFRRYLINGNRAFRLFDALGYEIVSNDSGHSVTRKRHTSLMQVFTGRLNEFEEQLISRTIALPILAYYQRHQRLRNLGLSKFDGIVRNLGNIVEVAQFDGPQFVFTHLMSPHAPFCFDSNGDPVARHPVFDASPWAEDRVKIPGYAQWYKAHYPDNVEGLNQHLRGAIQKVLEATDREAVILIQSDHGSALGLQPKSIDGTDLPERFGMFHAVFLPERYSGEHLDRIGSAVNTFPVLFYILFGLEIPLQEDRAWFDIDAFEFVDVTERARADRE